MPARAVPHMADMMLMGRVMDRMPMMFMVRTRLRVGLGKGEQASEYDKGRDEFFLHHHSWVRRPKRPVTGRGVFWAAQWGEKMTYAAAHND